MLKKWSKKEDEKDVDSSSKQEDAAILDQEILSHLEGNSFAEFALFYDLLLHLY